MIIGKISEHYSNIVNQIDYEQSFLGLINRLTEINKITPNYLLGIIQKVGNPNDTNTQANSAANNINTQVDRAIKSVRITEIAVAADRIKKLIANSESQPLKKLESATHNFIDALDEYMHSTSINFSLSLAYSAQELENSLLHLRDVNSILEPALGSKELPNITIYIPNRTSLEDFSAKLNALKDIIETCCKLLNLSMAEAEVEIERIESGSFFAKISANPAVVAVVTIIITHASQYIFSQDFLSSENVEIRENSESVIRILKIREALSKNGVDTEKLDAELNASAVLLAKQLNRLLVHSPSIEVNNKTFQAHETKLLESPAPIQDKKEQDPAKRIE